MTNLQTPAFSTSVKFGTFFAEDTVAIGVTEQVGYAIKRFAGDGRPYFTAYLVLSAEHHLSKLDIELTGTRFMHVIQTELTFIQRDEHGNIILGWDYCHPGMENTDLETVMRDVFDNMKSVEWNTRLVKLYPERMI